MAEKELQVIVKAKELALHTMKLTSNCNRYPKKYRHSLVDKMQNKCLDIYLVKCGKLSDEKFQSSYGAWKNHISHGDCKRLEEKTNKMIQTVLEGKNGE